MIKRHTGQGFEEVFVESAFVAALFDWARDVDDCILLYLWRIVEIRVIVLLEL